MNQSMVRAITYIESRFRDAVLLDHVAASARVSRFHLARRFRAEVGMSPMEYVRWRRVMEAKRLLRLGHEPLMWIAINLGYFDYSHFSRSFRSSTGMSPTQYKAANVQPLEAANLRAA